jgi:hypothetical protein
MHPCLVEWEVLPDDMRELDRKTVRELPAVVARVGFRVARLGGGVRKSSGRMGKMGEDSHS